MICADSWEPECYQVFFYYKLKNNLLFKQLLNKKVDIIAVPSFVSPSESWNNIWHGYKTTKPNDIDVKDIKHSLEKDMWIKVIYNFLKYFKIF